MIKEVNTKLISRILRRQFRIILDNLDKIREMKINDDEEL